MGDGTVSTTGLDRVAVVRALWEGSRAQGMSFVEERVPSDADIATALERGGYFDYFCGRVLKVDLSGDEFDPWGYDRDNGQGAAERVVATLRDQ